MVIRKQVQTGPLPYPRLQPHAQGTDDTSTLEAQHEPYSPSLHQSPAFNLNPLEEAQESPYDTMPNPWSDVDGEKPHQARLPSILQAGNGRPSSEKSQRVQDLPAKSRSGHTHKITPRSSFDSQRSRDFWEEEDDDSGRADQDLIDRDTKQNAEPPTYMDGVQRDALQSSPVSPGVTRIRRKPIGEPGGIHHNLDAHQSASRPLASNNPFRRLGGADDNALQERPWQDEQHLLYDVPPPMESLKGKEKAVDAGQNDTPVELGANLALGDRHLSTFSSSYRPSNIDLDNQHHAHESHSRPQTPSLHTPALSSAPPPPVADQNIITNEQSALIPLTPKSDHNEDTWAKDRRPRSPQPSDAGTPSRAHLRHKQDFVQSDGQETGIVGLGEQVTPISDFQSSNITSGEASSFEEQTQLLPTWPSEPPHQHPLQGDVSQNLETPPPKPPRPNIVPRRVSETEFNRLRGKRNEFYQIKHFNWFDHNTGKLRQSSMLTQNKNGPCPLLALVNALILGSKDATASALDDALKAREQVSLGLIIESLMDELTSDGRLDRLGVLPEVDVLNSFLLKLHTGMNANPRFTAPEALPPNLIDARNSTLHLLSVNSDRTPGTFELTQDMLLYAAFSIPLVHGWLPPPSHPSRAAFTRAAQTYEDAQTIQFGEEELEQKLSQTLLTPDEQQLLQDIMSIKHFLQCYPTQLTPYGLEVINESLNPGAFAILFRNDHFSTLYKHPESGQLFTLVTDAGYSDRAEVIWESLTDVSGKHSEFFSGDFRAVGGVDDAAGSLHSPSRQVSSTPTAPSSHRRRKTSGQRLNVPSVSSPVGPPSPQEQQEQADADFAMALQLQEEEDSRANKSRRRSGQSHSSTNRDRGSNIPIRLRSQQDIRPLIPPRNQHTSNLAVNRPADSSTDGEAPPPAYEEAAKGTPYMPPPGHPQHPSYDPGPQSSSSQIGPQSGLSRPGRRAERRVSTFQENAQVYGSPGMRGGHYLPSARLAHSVGRRKEPEKECIVM